MARLGHVAGHTGQRGIGSLYLGLARGAFKAAGGTPEVRSAPALGSYVRVGVQTADRATLGPRADPAPAHIGRLGPVCEAKAARRLGRALVHALPKHHAVTEHADLVAVPAACAQDVK